MKPKIVKPPKHLRAHTQWWCTSARGSFGGGGNDAEHDRAEAFRIRDLYRERGEDATVYKVTVRYWFERVEKMR